MTAWQTTTGRNRNSLLTVFAISLLLVVGMTQSLAAQTNYSASTPAGTAIANSASANYQDAGNNNYSAQSATVNTYVQQIDGYVLSPATYTLTGTANQNVQIKYTLTNYANGTEVTRLNINNIANVDIVAGSIHLYPDSGNAPNPGGGDQNGQNITIAQGGTYTFWFVGQMLSAADANNNKNFTVVATDLPASIPVPSGATGNWTVPTAYAGAGTTSTVLVKLNNGANVSVLKGVNPTSGTGGAVTTTLTYSNPGGTNATDIWITDWLGNGTTNYWSYASGANITWNGVSGITPGAGVQGAVSTVGPQGFSAAYYDGVTNKLNGKSTPALAFHITGTPFSAASQYQITFTLSTVGTISAPSSLPNQAQWGYTDGTNPVPAGFTAASDYCNDPTNASPACLVVIANYSLTQNFSATLTTRNDAGSYNPPSVYKSTIPQGVAGQIVYYKETVTNTGNGNDTIQLSTANTSFPAGTTFTYYDVGAGPGGTGAALTPTSGSNGSVNATFNSPILAPAANYNYIIAVQLPSNYTTVSPIAFNAQAKPNTGSGTLVTATDTLNTVVLPVDLLSGLTAGTQAAAAGAGFQVAGVTAPGVNPGASYTYELWIQNNQAAVDNFNIVASSTSSFSSTDTLNAGLSVAYTQMPGGTANCSSLVGGTSLTPPALATAVPVFTSGSPNATLVCAVVSAASGFAAGTQPVYFQATSAANSSIKDNLLDQFVVNAYYHVTVNSVAGNVNPGASVIYANTITNDGNQPITTISFAAGFVTDTPGGAPAGGVFTSTLYKDNPPVTQITTSTTYTSLAVGGVVTIYTQVNAALADQVGQNDTTTITVTYTTSGPTQTAVGVDTTNVVSAINNVTVTKTQSLDAGCTGTTFVPAVPAATNVQAKPGDCVLYRVAFTNSTGATVKNIYVSDQLNSYLTYCDGTGGTCGVAVAAGAWANKGASTESGSTTLVSGQLTSTTLNQVTSGQSAPYFQFEVKVK